MSEKNEINFPCNLCNACDYAVVWSDRKYEALKCNGCGIIRVSPQPDPEDIRHIYSRDYFEKYYLKYEKERKAYFRQRLAEIERIIRSEKARPPSMLDVGCGVGFFLEAAKEKGWHAEGAEISHFASEYVRKRTGFKVYTGDLAQADFPPGGFGVVTMWDVAAHLADPGGYLEKIRGLLADGGLLVIKTPDHPLRLFKLAKFLSFTAHSRGLLHIPAQIHHFDPENLSRLLERHGFRVIKARKIREALKGGWTPSNFKNFLIKSFNVFAKIIGIDESFVIYAAKLPRA